MAIKNSSLLTSLFQKKKKEREILYFFKSNAKKTWEKNTWNEKGLVQEAVHPLHENSAS